MHHAFATILFHNKFKFENYKMGGRGSEERSMQY